VTAEPTAAEIEAAARAMAVLRYPNTHESWISELRWRALRNESKAALAAALPLIEARLREQIAAEIEAAEVAGLEPGPGGLGPAARWGLGPAARIVRGA
jgi:hypothetical protein